MAKKPRAKSPPNGSKPRKATSAPSQKRALSQKDRERLAGMLPPRVYSFRTNKLKFTLRVTLNGKAVKFQTSTHGKRLRPTAEAALAYLLERRNTEVDRLQLFQDVSGRGRETKAKSVNGWIRARTFEIRKFLGSEEARLVVTPEDVTFSVLNEELTSEPSEATKRDAPRRSARTGREAVAAISAATLDPRSTHQAASTSEAPSTAYEAFRARRLSALAEDVDYKVGKFFIPLTLVPPDTAPGQGPQSKRTKFNNISEVFDEPGQARVVMVTGDPGAGKTHVLKRYEYDLLTKGTADEPTWPCPVHLGSYAVAMTGGDQQGLKNWLKNEWIFAAGEGAPSLDDLIKRGRVVFLLDGLNELQPQRREGYEERIALWGTFVRDVVLRGANRVVVSCRHDDYLYSLVTPDVRVATVSIQRLDREKVHAFLLTYEPKRGEAIWVELEKSKHLDAFTSPFLLKLLIGAQPEGANAPVTIPTAGAHLFTRFFRRALVREWAERASRKTVLGWVLHDNDLTQVQNEAWVNWDGYELPGQGPLVPALCDLAFKSQVAGERRQQGPDRSDAAVVFTLDQVKERMALADERVQQVIKAGVALQVLRREGPTNLAFGHQLWQEYFAARVVAERAGLDPVEEAKRATTPWKVGDLEDPDPDGPLQAEPQTGWETTLLLAAPMIKPVDKFLSALASENLPLAGRCAAQPGVKGRLALKTITDLQDGLLHRSRNMEADLRARIAAAKTLAELGDPRFTPPEPADGKAAAAAYLLAPFMKVPGEPYIRGSARVGARTKPAKPFEIEPFEIAQFPVTNAEWKHFMDAGGYENPAWWMKTDQHWWSGGSAEDAREQLALLDGIAPKGLTEHRDALRLVAQGKRPQHPLLWHDQNFNHPSQPVVGVSWHEARAYCVWLSSLRGEHFRLPTEAEWEATAAGVDQARPYPWGHEASGNGAHARCNTWEAVVGRTTPVGVFPLGDTLPDAKVRASDLSGNVWEWTTSEYESSPYEAAPEKGDLRRDDPTLTARRVVRGGSWSFSLADARVSSRGGSDPGNRGSSLGFRVVRVSSSDPLLAERTGH